MFSKCILTFSLHFLNRHIHLGLQNHSPRDGKHIAWPREVPCGIRLGTTMVIELVAVEVDCCGGCGGFVAAEVV